MSKIGDKEQTILILGRAHLNRAVHGDVVVVRLLPTSEWRTTPTSIVIDEGKYRWWIY
jgi:exoribonuclease R